MNNKKTLIVSVLLFLALEIGVVEVLMHIQGEALSTPTQLLWMLIYIVLTILWAVEDSKSVHFEKPFDFDFLMYIFWPVAFPYYLIATRGMKGILLLIGFLAVWSGPRLAGEVVNAYISGAG